MRAAEDAVLVDTSTMSIADAVARAVAEVEARGARQG
jgi:cytidylate kinase